MCYSWDKNERSPLCSPCNSLISKTTSSYTHNFSPTLFVRYKFFISLPPSEYTAFALAMTGGRIGAKNRHKSWKLNIQPSSHFISCRFHFMENDSDLWCKLIENIGRICLIFIYLFSADNTSSDKYEYATLFNLNKIWTRTWRLVFWQSVRHIYW